MSREVILQCALTNQKYMHLRVGNAGFPRVVKLYRRLAEVSVALAEEYSSGAEHPSPHEPAADAFWWAVQGWSSRFMRDVLDRSPTAAFKEEMMGHFHLPHLRFAMWLRPLGVIPLYPPTPPMESATALILCHDSFWTMQVIRLTARWGLWQHMKDVPALIEIRRLLWRLRKLPSDDPVTLAYLESDIMFLVELFGHFNFPPEGNDLLRRFLDVAIDEAAAWRQQPQGAP